MRLEDLTLEDLEYALENAPPALRARAESLAEDRVRRWRYTLDKAGGLDVDKDLLDWMLWNNPGYLPGRVHRDVTYRLMRFSEAVALGQSPRLMLVLPPRHGKTEMAGRRWPVWHMRHNPGHEVVYATYGQALSNKVSRAARGIADRSVELWPHDMGRGEAWGVEYWNLEQRQGAARAASFNATSVGGALTGDGAHVLILDDLIKDAAAAQSQVVRDNAWDWYQSTAATRLAPGGGVLAMGTRWHEDDPMGRMLADTETGGAWEVVRYPALAEEAGVDWRPPGAALHPERYTEADLKDIRATVGERFWAALYQGRPTPRGGGVFQEAWTLGRYTAVPAPARMESLISCDATFDGKPNSDWVAIQVWARDSSGRKFLLESQRHRMDYVATRKVLVDVCERHPTAVLLMERAANGPALISDLRGTIRQGIIGWNPRVSKLMRAQLAARDWESGKVYLPSFGPWREAFVQELIRFTGKAGGRDDQVDAMSAAFLYWSRGELAEVGFESLGSWEGAGVQDEWYDSLPIAG